MRALAVLLVGLALAALFAGSGRITPGGTLTFVSPGAADVVLALGLLGAGLVAAFFAQGGSPKVKSGGVKETQRESAERPAGYLRLEPYAYPDTRSEDEIFGGHK